MCFHRGFSSFRGLDGDHMEYVGRSMFPISIHFTNLDKRFHSRGSLPPPGLLGNNPGHQIYVGSSNLWLGCTGCWVNDHALLNRRLLSIRKSVPYQHQKQHRGLLDSRSGLCCSCLDTPDSNHGLLHPRVHPDSLQPRSQHE